MTLYGSLAGADPEALTPIRLGQRWGPRAQYLRAIDFLHTVEEADAV